MGDRRWTARWTAAAAALAGMWLTAAPMAAAGPRDDDDRDHERSPSPSYYDFSDVTVSGEFNATPGGAQDITYFRSQVAGGLVPRPEVFTAEGLLSEHDLPLAPRARCDRLLCANAAAVAAELPSDPGVAWLAELGFTSNLTEATFHRPPLNLVAVVDQSCSMSGAPLDHVKVALTEVIDQLVDGDQLSVVVYGSTPSVWLPPTPATARAALKASIGDLATGGSTNLEAGLLAGYALARDTRRSFDGTTRVMLFTDERPNVGRTDAVSFGGLARAASLDGIGTTTVGVGVAFGAELAQAVSAVRGGNLVYFADPADMAEGFRERFDQWVTELAYDMRLDVRPAEGLTIQAVYGLPGDAIARGPDGAVTLELATLFLSRDAGAIYLGFAPKPGAPAVRPAGASLGDVSIRFTARDGSNVARTYPIAVGVPGPGDAGLTRGPLLVDTYTSLVRATTLYHDGNDAFGAWQVVDALHRRLRATTDPTMGPEITLAEQLAATLAPGGAVAVTPPR